MAKKVSKILLLGAAIGAAAAGTYYYLKKKDSSFYDEEDEEEDFDVFEEDDDLNAVTGEGADRNYVPLSFDTVSAVSDDAPAKDVTLDGMESVEEFFDEEDDELADDTPIEEE